MSGGDARSRLITVFTSLRHRGLTLGISELLDALRAVDGGWGAGSDDALKRVARLLWCRTPLEVGELEDAWEDTSVAFPEPESADPADDASVPHAPNQGKVPLETGNASPPTLVTVDQRATGTWVPLPFVSPVTEEGSSEGSELIADRPISRRSMAYAWRHLRRPAPEGPADVLDIEATVGRVASQGLYLAPVWRRRLINQAQLVILLDQNGSMVPFHRFTRDLVETARFESTIARVECYYFHNVPPDNLYLNPHMTEPVPWDHLASGMTSETAVLIVSDAGAARGHRRLERILATTRFLVSLGGLTERVACLNPMPEGRWASTSAAAIARVVPMFPMDSNGLERAVDMIRGLAIQPGPHQ
jgi:uncharacterized protein with von Willebrand factor type A (vWA) domain